MFHGTLHGGHKGTPLTSNDSPVGGADAKHQIVIGLFVLGSLKIPRPRLCSAARRPGDVGWWYIWLYTHPGEVKNGSPQKNIPIVVTFQIEPFFISMIVGGRVNLVKFGLAYNRFDTQKDLDFFFRKQPSKTPVPGTRLRSTTPQTDLHCSMSHGLNDASAL